jgi:hypothetical protein
LIPLHIVNLGASGSSLVRCEEIASTSFQPHPERVEVKNFLRRAQTEWSGAGPVPNLCPSLKQSGSLVLLCEACQRFMVGRVAPHFSSRGKDTSELRVLLHELGNDVEGPGDLEIFQEIGQNGCILMFRLDVLDEE